jgi:hypothetical protein
VSRFAVVWFIAGSCSSIAFSDDWPRWCGPNLDGISRESNWTAEWPQTVLNRLWTCAVGIGFSFIVVQSDGLPYNWSIHNEHFGDSTPVLDFVHALSYVYRASIIRHNKCDLAWSTDTRCIGESWHDAISFIDQIAPFAFKYFLAFAQTAVQTKFFIRPIFKSAL